MARVFRRPPSHSRARASAHACTRSAHTHACVRVHAHALRLLPLIPFFFFVPCLRRRVRASAVQGEMAGRQRRRLLLLLRRRQQRRLLRWRQQQRPIACGSPPARELSDGPDPDPRSP